MTLSNASKVREKSNSLDKWINQSIMINLFKSSQSINQLISKLIIESINQSVFGPIVQQSRVQTYIDLHR